jgi:hypothetical protein
VQIFGLCVVLNHFTGQNNFTNVDGIQILMKVMMWLLGNITESGVLLTLLLFNLKNFHLVYMFSNLVKTMKFLILFKNARVSSNDDVYELPNDVAAGIHLVIVALDDID